MRYLNVVITVLVLSSLVACSSGNEPEVLQSHDLVADSTAWILEVVGGRTVWLAPDTLADMDADPDRVRLSIGDLQIPSMPVDGGLLFDVPDMATRYTERTHVRLESDRYGTLMQIGQPSEWITRHHELNQHYLPQATVDVPWFWEPVYAPGSVTYDLPITATGPITVTFHLWSHTDMVSDEGAEHGLKMYFDGHPVGRWMWDGIGMQHLSSSWDVTAPGQHTLTVETLALQDVDAAVIWIDSWDVVARRGQIDGVESEALSAARAPLVIRPVEQVNLSALADVDYLILAPERFYAPLQPLLDRRIDQGLTPALLPPQSIYDTLGTGQPDPEAIMALVEELPDLRYLLLVGDGSVELDGYDGEAGALRIVSPLTRTHFLGETPADGLLGGDRVAVGRLPAASVREVRTMVDKIIGWEEEPAYSVVLLSDDQSDFRGMNDHLSELIPNTIGHISGDARDEAIDALGRRGRIWANYVGHGSVISLGSLLNREDSSAWREPGLVVAWTCLAAHFGHPSESSLAETWLRSRRHGVVAFIGPTGETLTSQQQPVAEAFYRALPAAERLGDAWLAALNTEPAGDVAAGYVILGDPAMMVEW